MIRGRSIAAGTMTVDGEELTGIFVECSVDELRDKKFSIFNEVTLLTASEIAERSPDTTGPTVLTALNGLAHKPPGLVPSEATALNPSQADTVEPCGTSCKWFEKEDPCSTCHLGSNYTPAQRHQP